MKYIVFFFLYIFLGGCHYQSTDLQVNNINLSDRIKACSLGFTENTQTSLHASSSPMIFSGDISSDFKEETKSVIFSEVAEKDRLKAYEDYLVCIETEWNK